MSTECSEGFVEEMCFQEWLEYRNGVSLPICGGTPFHSVGSATEKDRRPYRSRWYRGIFILAEFVVVPTNLPLILLLPNAAFSGIFLENGVDSCVDCGHKLGRCNSISLPGGGRYPRYLDILPPPNAQVVWIPNYFRYN